MQEEPSGTPTKELHSTKFTHKSSCGDTIDVGEPEEDLVRNSEAPFAVASNDRASSSWDNSHLVLWRGHEVNSEFVGLLDLITKRYPETFKELPTKNKRQPN